MHLSLVSWSFRAKLQKKVYGSLRANLKEFQCFQWVPRSLRGHQVCSCGFKDSSWRFQAGFACCSRCFRKFQGILRGLVVCGSLGGFRVGLWRFKVLQCVSQCTSRGLRTLQRVFPGISKSFKDGCREGFKRASGSFQRELH